CVVLRDVCYDFCLNVFVLSVVFFFSSRRRHTRFKCDWSSDVCSSDLGWHHVCRRQAACPSNCGDDEGARDATLAAGSGIRGIPQIGRASCRERGEKVGVGEAMKNKGEQYEITMESIDKRMRRA